jgi:hypothetical protein
MPQAMYHDMCSTIEITDQQRSGNGKQVSHIQSITSSVSSISPLVSMRIAETPGTRARI